MTAEVATTQQVPSPRQEIAALAPQFAMALGGQQLAERFVRVALTALGRNPKLGECTRDSLLGGLLTCAQLRLEPNDPRGLAYLIPFENRKQRTVEAQLVIGYKGLIDLAYRSGQIKTIAAEPVHENDEFTEQRWPRRLTHKAAAGDRGKVVTYYAAVEYKDGGQDFAVMSVDEVERHRDLYSKGYQRDDSPWKTAFDAMARKTVLRKLAKMMPLSVEDLRQFAAAVHVDGTIGTVEDSHTLDDLFTREQQAVEAAEATTPARVTFAEIKGDDDACPECGVTPRHLPTECPGAAQTEPML